MHGVNVVAPRRARARCGGSRCRTTRTSRSPAGWPPSPCSAGAAPPCWWCSPGCGPRRPAPGELTAAVVAVPVATLQVVSRCARWSVRHPYPADLRRGRDTPAPPVGDGPLLASSCPWRPRSGALLVATGAVVDAPGAVGARAASCCVRPRPGAAASGPCGRTGLRHHACPGRGDGDRVLTSSVRSRSGPEG